MKFKGKEFSRAVKTKRTIKEKITSRVLAAKIGISHSSIVRVENGATPCIYTYCALCEWLGYSADKFLK